MAMNVGSANDTDDEIVSTINTTPLVDVMLVLLIIFLITIPVVTKAIALDLPKVTNQPRITKPENITLAVTKDGNVYWNDVLVPGKEELVNKLKEVAVITPQPEIHIRGDGGALYESIGKVVFACQRSGIAKIGFLTEPPPKG
ncbi:MAG: biopolymer transporter ExbD [Methylophilaceae bacterium]|nr:biopolymer transporter ExbD [Methylophilaceae bacterium]